MAAAAGVVALRASGAVLDIKLSPDGKLGAVGRNDGSVQVMGRPRLDPKFSLDGHKSSVWSVSWLHDRRHLVSGHADGKMILWDVEQRQKVGEFQGHTGDVFSIKVSPDGSMLLSGSQDKTVRLWRVSDRTCLATLNVHSYYLYDVDWSADGSRFAICSHEGKVLVYDARTQAVLLTLAHRSIVCGVAYSPDSRMLATGCNDKAVRLYDAVSGQLLFGALQGHTNTVWRVAFSPNGQLLASGSEDNTVRLWNVASGSCVHVLQGHTSVVRAVCFTPGGEYLLSGSKDGTVRLWRVSSGAAASVDSAYMADVMSKSDPQAALDILLAQPQLPDSVPVPLVLVSVTLYKQQAARLRGSVVAARRDQLAAVQRLVAEREEFDARETADEAVERAWTAIQRLDELCAKAGSELANTRLSRERRSQLFARLFALQAEREQWVGQLEVAAERGSVLAAEYLARLEEGE